MPAERIAAVVLAAGRSSRMGQSKLVLPWGKTTVIGQVVVTLAQAGVDEIVVVTGGGHKQVEDALVGLPARAVYNPEYTQDYMILTLQAGLRSLSVEAGAVLIALGDQPQMDVVVARQVIQLYRDQRAALVVPSYQMRRGHPWLAARALWDDLLTLRPPETTRDFLNAHAADIQYLVVETDAILRDLDTPQDYARDRPAPAAGGLDD